MLLLNRKLSVFILLVIFLFLGLSFCLNLIYFPILLITLLSIIFTMSETNIDIFHGKIFIIAYITFFSIGAIQWIPDPHVYWAFWLEPVSYNTIILITFGLAAFVFGWRGVIKIRKNQPSVYSVNDIFKLKMNTVIILLDLLLFILAELMFSKSGIPILENDVQIARLNFAESSQILLTIASFICHFILYISLVIFKGQRRKWKVILVLSSLFALLFLFSFGGRYYLIDPLIGCLLLYSYYIKKINTFKLSILTLFGMVMFSVYGLIRESQYFGSSRVPIYKSLGFPNDFTAMFAPTLEYIRVPIVVLCHELGMVPGRVPFQMGALITNPLTQFLPGSTPAEDVWLKEKVMNISFDLGAGTPGSLLSVFYGDFGWIGVILEMFLLGIGLRYAYKKMVYTELPEWIVLSAILLKDCLLGLFVSVFPYFINVFEPFIFYFAIYSLREINLGKKRFNKNIYKILSGISLLFIIVIILFWFRTGVTI